MSREAAHPPGEADKFSANRRTAECVADTKKQRDAGRSHGMSFCRSPVGGRSASRNRVRCCAGLCPSTQPKVGTSEVPRTCSRYADEPNRGGMPHAGRPDAANRHRGGTFRLTGQRLVTGDQGNAPQDRQRARPGSTCSPATRARRRPSPRLVRPSDQHAGIAAPGPAAVHLPYRAAEYHRPHRSLGRRKRR
jgi:hypothetical protein